MKMKLPRMSKILFAAATALILSQPAPAAAVGRDDKEAEAFIKDFTDKIVLVIANKNRALAKRHNEIHDLLLANVDTNRIGRFMLGRYARKISRDELPTYINLMEDYAMRVFIDRLLLTKNAHTARIKILRSTKKGSSGKEAIITSQLTVKNIKEPIQVRWWLVRDKNNQLKIFNIGVEGFWLAQEQRAAFIALIQKNKGDPKALLNYLRGRIKKAKQNTPREQELSLPPREQLSRPPRRATPR